MANRVLRAIVLVLLCVVVVQATQDEPWIAVAKQLNLTQQPLGNYFAETWVSNITVPTSVLPTRFRGTGASTRTVSSAIYNLFVGETCVVPIHNLAAEETWHVYGLGSALCMHLLEFDVVMGSVNVVCVGNNIADGCTPQHTVPHTVWMGAYFPKECFPQDEEPWLLTGAQLAPGFDPADSKQGKRADFIKRFPMWTDLVILLTPGQ
eukprot:TRINITY_DN14031_c0_g1_i1.p1 TRINITY_DN14031_c0_g1~~TRINITY_DN14031_c0_g1_i1.p1  ORF type:complete len:221 (-),score=33.31 TRINITY_DN14031_c0_g1_i1:280-900(-)